MQNNWIHPYLFLGGRCEEALDFYKKALGAKVDMVMRFSESPDPVPPGMIPPGYENKVMHSSFHVGDAMVMASDGCGPNEKLSGFSLSLSYGTEAEVDKAFKGLSEGGKVTMPLMQTFWSKKFGSLTDRFGVNWMVMVTPEQPK